MSLKKLAKDLLRPAIFTTRTQRYGKLCGLAVLLFSLQIMLVANPASAADPTNSSNSVWPTEASSLRYNPTHNAVWGKAVDSNINWTFTAAMNGMSDNLFTDVIAANGMVYVGSMMNQVYAVNAETGKLAWQFGADNWIMTDPVIADGKLFVGSGNRYFVNKHLRGTGKSTVYALDAMTGKQLWSYNVGGEAMPTPVYSNGTVYFATGDRALYALDANTGTLKFKVAVDSYFSMSSPSLDGNLLFVGGAKPFGVYAFDVSKGTVAWKSIFDGVYLAMDDCSPAVANGKVFTEGITQSDTNGTTPPPHDVIYALNEKDSSVVWSFDEGAGTLIDDNKCGTPVAQDGVLYASSPITNKFFALDQATGKELWEYKLPAPSRGGSVVMGNYVVFGDMKANVYALDRTSGKLVKKVNLGGVIAPDGPSIYNGTVYVADQNGHLIAFSLLHLLGSVYTQTAPVTSTVNSNTQYFAQTGHSVSGDFLKYWQQNGGLAQFGYPLTEPFYQFQSSNGGTYLVQYFERARLEYHPELTSAPVKIELGRLGVNLVANRTNEAPFQPLKNAPAASSQSTFFTATKHSLSGQFLQYWQTHGGLAIFGYPLSEPFTEVNPTDGKSYTVQYFERARLEYHPEQTNPAYKVELGQLGRQILNGSVS